ncbi:NhaP-type Na+/H+ or K+/H+ antiporter [Enterococcus sp. PF1-24]|uniref:YjzD family protein n=1 Tax=unclassified Enterococcus TaxID=2608891 RepID=UPI002473E0D1|nr:MULTISPECIES: YjzD family protein [unclassified Enterococcus]MDH6365255.1 NhaP-type Na+/H+ or K+/H+ antiporter [Enterococcus sp. PFB1-1]MDH6402356.1 NhaP-type Na+/H+ or K+/H+ antiporter [Enterococcus sp. PF1-24]
MRYLTTIFWALLLGQIVGYLGGALTSSTYTPATTAVVSLILGIVVILIGEVAKPSSKKTSSKHL